MYTQIYEHSGQRIRRKVSLSVEQYFIAFLIQEIGKITLNQPQYNLIIVDVFRIIVFVKDSSHFVYLSNIGRYWIKELNR